MNSKRKIYEDDDGRVICDMNVDGMKRHGTIIRQRETALGNGVQTSQMTASDARRFTWHAVLAVMLIASVFSLTWILFILFCTKIWFR